MPLGRICNPTAPNISICNEIIGLQVLILRGSRIANPTERIYLQEGRADHRRHRPHRHLRPLLLRSRPPHVCRRGGTEGEGRENQGPQDRRRVRPIASPPPRSPFCRKRRAPPRGKPPASCRENQGLPTDKLEASCREELFAPAPLVTCEFFFPQR